MAQWINREAMKRHNPKGSWWAECPRQNFTRACERETERMRLSEFGMRPLVTSKVFEPSAMELARARKRIRGYSEAAA